MDDRSTTMRVTTTHVDSPPVPEVAFVVPTRNSARTLERCLESIRDQRGVEIELVVVDNHSTDGTADTARRLAHTVAVRGPERSAQRNHGLRLTSAPIVAFIDSDMVLEPDIAREAVAAFAADQQCGGLVIPERAFGRGFWARCRALEKDLYQGDADVEAARIFRRPALEAVGGFDEQLNAMEDWELADRVEATGWKTHRLESVVWHDEGRLSLAATFAKKQYYGEAAIGYLDRPASQRRPMTIGRFIRHPALLARRPLETAGLVVLKSAETGGLLVGVLRGRQAKP